MRLSILANVLVLLILSFSSPVFASVSDSDYKLYSESGKLFNGDDSFDKLESLSKQITNEMLSLINGNITSQSKLNKKLQGISTLLDSFYTYLNKLNRLDIHSPELIKIKQQTLDFYQGFYKAYIKLVESIKAGNLKAIESTKSTFNALGQERDQLLLNINELAKQLTVIRDQINRQYGSYEAAKKYFDKPGQSGYERAVAAYDKKDYKVAFEEWSVLANKGDAKSQYNLGVMYSKGKGVAKNYKEALFWFNKAAAQGHLQAARNAKLLDGKKMPTANDEVFEDAVDSYKDGNYARALALWTELADKGDARAEFNIGVMYHKGKGVPKNQAEALKWYRKAAAQGHEAASKNLKLIEKSDK